MYINNDIDYLNYLKKKTVFIFGAGLTGKNCMYNLKKREINVEGFIDNNSTLCGTRIENLLVYSITEYLNLEHSETIIVICSQYEREIKQQLLNADIFNFISVSQIDFGGGEEYYDEAYFEFQQEIGKFGAVTQKKYFEKYITEDMTVIEFGSGGGYLLKEINAKDKIGIEINPAARKFAEKQGIKSVTVAEELVDGYADIIISTHALEHVENPMGILRSLRKKLKDGGKAVFVVPNESCEKEYIRSDINNEYWSWNCLNLGNLFKGAGYFVYSVESIKTVWPRFYNEIRSEVSEEFFNELCRIEGAAFGENNTIIVAYK